MSLATPSPTPAAVARALADLPPPPPSVKHWRILLLVSAVNSLTQRVLTHLADLGFDGVSTELALSDDDMYGAVIAHSPHVVLCPFLVKKVPDGIFRNVITLIVHPGPPGDAGPAALDWAILGDRGLEADAAQALQALQAPVDRALPLAQRQRTHWGVTVLQADETLDGGPVWAFDQFPLPDIATLTKSALYQNQVSSAVLRAVTVALARLGESFATRCDPADRATWMGMRADAAWAGACVSYGAPFLGGGLHDRPQIKPGQRRPRLAEHTAADVARIVNCGDSQPGATLPTAKSFLFVYDAHVHLRAADLPASVRLAFDSARAGDAVATRSGAVLFKTATCGHGAGCVHGCGAAIWLTHGRVPKAANSGALNPKVPLAEAMVAAGEGARLQGAPEWALDDFAEKEGTWQQAFVRSVAEGNALVQLVHWDFYNGAFSTTGCQLLLRALQWAADPARGNVKLLALMGGSYFSNGVALNIIEAAEHPGHETWANINAIDDVVEFLAGDVSRERSPFLSARYALPERGIVTVACLRGNAAAGGVALAAACDVVLAANSVVLNPAYRAMGLHGSELHLYSYVERCGRDVATHLVRDMLPLSASNACDLGLVDAVVGGRDVGRDEAETLLVERLRLIARSGADAMASDWFASAPWLRPFSSRPSTPFESAPSLVAALCDNKRTRYAAPDHIPLLHFRNEELSQMLLDNFHPARSVRYHSRRIKFVRKVKAGRTPNRFVRHRVHATLDEEEDATFDYAPGWQRGEEWTWVGDVAPASMASSEHLRIDFAARVQALPLRRPSQLSQMTQHSHTSALSGTTDASSSLHTDSGADDDTSIVLAPSAVAVNGMPLSPPPSAGLLSGAHKMLKPKQRESLGTAAPASVLAKPILKQRPASFGLPRSAERDTPSRAPASESAVVPMPTSLPTPPPIVLTADLSGKARTETAKSSKRMSRDVFGTSPRSSTPQLEHVLQPPPRPPTASPSAAPTPANTPRKVGRFATLSKLLRPKRETGRAVAASPPVPAPAAASAADAHERARRAHLAQTQLKLSSPKAAPASALAPARRSSDRLDPAAAAHAAGAVAALGRLSVDAARYDRPVVPNEGDTESPCLFNTVGDMSAFPAVPDRPVAVRA